MRLREAEKRTEVLKINGDERVNLAIDAKDKEQARLQEKLNALKMENDIIVNKLETKVAELMKEMQNKDKSNENFKIQAGHQQQMLQQHIEKMKDVLTQKTEIATQMDQTNRIQQDQLNEYKQQIASIENKLSNALSQAQFDRNQFQQEKFELISQHQQQTSQLEMEHQRLLKDAERDKKRIQRDFENLKQQLLQKEQGVKTEIERVWTDWEDRCTELDDLKQQAEFRLNESEARVRDLSKSIINMKKEAKDHRELADQARQELKIVQSKYEEELQKKDSEYEMLKSEYRAAEDRMQFEIMHLKTELEKQFKKQIASQMAANTRMRIFQNEQDKDKINQEGGSSFKMTLNRIASIAQNSIRQSQEKAAPLFNDSLDYMKRDFMNQFNRLMETEVPPSVDKNGGSARNMSPINR